MTMERLVAMPRLEVGATNYEKGSSARATA